MPRFILFPKYGVDRPKFSTFGPRDPAQNCAKLQSHLRNLNDIDMCDIGLAALTLSDKQFDDHLSIYIGARYLSMFVQSVK